ncbi:MAG TPA: hypothetical protein VF789_33835 [Thermoanaerobaculia bacterium]
MSKLKLIALGAVTWTVSIGLLHGWLNLGFNPFSRKREVAEETRFRVGFLPVT